MCNRHVLELKNSDGSGDGLPLPSIGYLMLVTITIVFYEGKLPARMYKGIDLRFPYTLFWDKRTRPRTVVLLYHMQQQTFIISIPRLYLKNWKLSYDYRKH